MNPNADAIRSFITESFLFGDPAALPADGESLLAAGVIDSTDVLELVVFLERHFGIRVADSDVTPENFDSVNRLLDYVGTQLEAATARVAL